MKSYTKHSNIYSYYPNKSCRQLTGILCRIKLPIDKCRIDIDKGMLEAEKGKVRIDGKEIAGAAAAPVNAR